MCDMPSAKMSKEAMQREKDYKAESDHRTLTDAAEIQGDPERMAGVMRHHRKKTRALARVGNALRAGRRGGRSSAAGR